MLGEGLSLEAEEEAGKGCTSCLTQGPVPEEALTAESTTSSEHLCPSLPAIQGSDNTDSGSLMKMARRTLVSPAGRCKDQHQG